MMKRILTSLFLSAVLLVFLPGRANAAGDVALNAANFPDPAFRTFLAEEFDTDGNGILSEAEIAKAKGLYCDNKGITDLTGIKNLTSLIVLNCSYNQISTLDLSSCVTLKNVLCYNNGMTSLNLQGCSALEQVDCYGNQLTSLKLQGCAALQSLSCQRNRLTSLDVSSRSGLTKLSCNDNHLTFLDASNCPALPELVCSNNQLVTLNVSGCTALQKLYCDNSNLSSLNVGSCPALQVLKCDKNSLTSLDVSKNYELTFLSCAENRIPSLDMRSCTKLVRLICNNNHLTTLDLGTCQDLTSLECSGNQLTALNLSGCRNLDYLFCYMNNLAALDVTPTKLLTVCNPAEYAPFGVGSQKCGDIRVSMTAEQKTFYEKNAETASDLNAGVIPVESFYDAEAVTITAQPKNVTLALGSTGKFTVTASGTGLTYQWQYKSATGTAWTNSGNSTAKTATLEMKADSTRNGMQFRCMVKDAAGNTATSDPATMTITSTASGLTITTQPKNMTLALGETGRFTVAATGSGLTYQWQYKSAAGAIWSNSGNSTAKTAALSMTADTTRQGMQFRCVIKDSAGKTVTSSPATMTIKAAITAQPKNVIVVLGETGKFSVTAFGKGITYQWQYKSATGTAWKNSSNSTAKTATLSMAADSSRDFMQFRCIVTDSLGNTATSDPATMIIIASGAAITSQPKDVMLALGETAKFSVTATGTGIVYRWQYKSAAATSWTNSNSTTARTATLSMPADSTRNGMQFRCVIKDPSGKTVTSDPATMTIKAAITAQPKNVTLALGETGRFSVTAIGNGLTYQWQYKSATGTAWKNSSNATAKSSALNMAANSTRQGMQFRCIVTDMYGNTVISSAATMTIQ